MHNISVKLLFVVVLFKELEVQQQSLREISRAPSFCGPEKEKNTKLDCISIPHKKIQDLHTNGRQMLQEPIMFLHLYLEQRRSVLFTLQDLSNLNMQHAFTHLIRQGLAVKGRWRHIVGFSS